MGNLFPFPLLFVGRPGCKSPFFPAQTGQSRMVKAAAKRTSAKKAALPEPALILTTSIEIWQVLVFCGNVWFDISFPSSPRYLRSNEGLFLAQKGWQIVLLFP
jgi:hypothetical protein